MSKMRARPPDRHWIQVRIELFRRVYHHVQLILGESKGKLKSFEKAYEAEFAKEEE